MRILLLMVFLFVITNISAQEVIERRINFAVKNVTIPEALLKLSEQSNTSIAFQPTLFDSSQKISIDAYDKRVLDVLKQCLQNTAVTFEYKNGRIRLFKKKIKRFTISGFIIDRNSGEKLVSATLYESINTRGVVANDYGFFNLKLPEGLVDIQVSYLGYEQFKYSFDLRQDTVINVHLNPSLTLSEVIITDQNRNLSSGQFSVGRGKLIVRKDLAGTSSLGGETDIIRHLLRKPGVQSGADGLGGIHVRGGNADQNLVLLDGSPVFNPSHTLGLFSIFNNESFRSAQFLNEGFSAKYGGRLSSVIDVRSKEGNTEQFQGALEIGTFASKATFEIPIKQSKSALLISGRRTHLDPFIRNFSRNQKADEENEGESDYHFYDFNARFHTEIGDRDKLFLSYYEGKDNYEDLTYWGFIYEDDLGQEFDIYSEQNQALSWGNKLGSIRWNHVFGNHLFLNTTLTYSRYAYKSFNNSIYQDDGDPMFPYENVIWDTRSRVEDLGVNISFDHFVSDNHQLSYGLSYLERNFSPATVQQSSETDSIAVEAIETIVDRTASNIAFDASEVNFYLEDKIQLSKTELLIGIRSASFTTTNSTYISIQPRLNLSFPLGESFNGRIAFSKMSQFLHVLTSSDAGLPTDLWVPSTANIGPQHAWQISGGIVKEFKGINVGVSGYYKWMDGLLTYAEETKLPGLVETDPTYWEDFVIQGYGKSYGVEFELNKSEGNTEVYLNYSFTNSIRRFEEINGGVEFPFSFERPHAINLNLSHKIGKQSSLHIGWQFQSGRPITLQKTDIRFLPLDNFYYEPEIVSPLNGYRLPSYHRLDVNFQFKWGKGSVLQQLNLGVYNLYNRSNVYYQYIFDDIFEEEEYFRDLRALPILPSVSYRLAFKGK